jgi:hypothetical protein
MRRVFIRDLRKFDELARAVHAIALSGCSMSLRDGLNLGGGDYYSFESDATRVILAYNDPAHPDVFVPEHAECAYSLYVYLGDASILHRACQCLNQAGIAAYLTVEDLTCVGTDRDPSV